MSIKLQNSSRIKASLSLVGVLVRFKLLHQYSSSPLLIIIYLMITPFIRKGEAGQFSRDNITSSTTNSLQLRSVYAKIQVSQHFHWNVHTG